MAELKNQYLLKWTKSNIENWQVIKHHISLKRIHIYQGTYRLIIIKNLDLCYMATNSRRHKSSKERIPSRHFDTIVFYNTVNNDCALSVL